MFGEFKDKLASEFNKIACEKGFLLIAFSILEDHVHLLVKQSISDTTNYVMRMFKGISSRNFFLEYPSNRYEYRKLWGRGYFAREVKEEDIPKVKEYISNQIDKNGFDKRYSFKRNREVHSQVSFESSR